MFDVKYTTRFKKDYKLLKKRGYDMNKLLDAIDILREGRELSPCVSRWKQQEQLIKTTFKRCAG
jgi:addiction module RelE/StbE family toxin